MPNFSTNNLNTYTAYQDGTIHGNDPTAASDASINIWSAVASVLHGNGYLSFFHSRVEMTTTGTARVYVHRMGGFSGAVSCDIATYNTTGNIAMNSTTHFTAMSETISFAAGEVGLKYVDITVGTAPAAGLHMFGVEMTNATGGATIRHSVMHVYFDNGSPNTSATSVTASTAVSAVSVANPSLLTVADSSVFRDDNGDQTSILAGLGTTPDINGAQVVTIVNATTISVPVNVTAVSDGVGTATTAELETAVNSASAGDLIYARDTGGDYIYNYRTAGQVRGGHTFNVDTGIKTAPVILRNYPGETPKLNPGNSGTHDGAGNNVDVGILLIKDAAKSNISHFHIGGIEIVNCMNSGIHFGAYPTYNVVVEDMNIHDVCKLAIGDFDVATHADNVGGLRLDDAEDVIIRNNSIHHIYDPRSGAGFSNPYDAEPYGLHSGIHGYRPKNQWIQSNNIYNVNDAVFSKDPYQLTSLGSDNAHVSHNWFYNVAELCLHLSTQGSGKEPAHNIFVHHNVAELDDTTSTADVALVGVNYANDITSQPDGVWIFNNTQIGGDWLFDSSTMTGIVAYNNISQNLINNLAIEGDDRFGAGTWDNQLEYCDYNCWNNITSTKFMTDRNGDSTEYTSLASWQTAFSVDANDQLDREMDNNSIITAPTYVNSAGKDFTTTAGVTVDTGRFGRDIGIESEVVGVV